MAFYTIHASKDGEWVEAQFTSPTLTTLLKTGWDVHIADSDGRRYGPKASMRFYHSIGNRRSNFSMVQRPGADSRELIEGNMLTEFDQNTIANMTAAHYVCKKIPPDRDSTELRKRIADELIQCARSGKRTVIDLQNAGLTF